MAMQELNQTEVAEVSGALLFLGGPGSITGNLPFVLAGLPFFLLGLLGQGGTFSSFANV